MTNTYRHYSHEDAIKVVEDALYSAGVNYSLKFQQLNTNKMVANFQFDDYLIEGLGGLVPQISVVNSTDKSTALKLIGGVFRLVCSNGLVAGDVFDSERIIHRVGETFERKIQTLPTRIVALIDDIIAAVEEFKELREQTLTEETMISVVGNLPVNKKTKRASIDKIVFEERRRIQDQGNNVWTLYNIVNESLRNHTPIKSYTTKNEGLLEHITALVAA